MPMVPETFAPSVSQGDMPMTPVTGPWVSPMRNSAPGLLQQTGQTLSQAGAEATKLGNTIGDAVQQTVDGALTKAAETQFLKSSQDVLTNPQSGYLNTRGMDAQAKWNDAAKAISQARQDQRATLTNPIQQRMFDLATNDHMLSMGQQMNDHQHQQVTQFAIQQSQDHADSVIIQARDAFLAGRQGDYQKNLNGLESDVMKVAELNGASPDSDVAQAMLRAKRGELVSAITSGLRDDHKYDLAKQYFDAEKDNIDPKLADALGSSIKVDYDRNLTEVKGDAFLAAAQSGGKVPYTYGPLATGSTINPMRITDVPGSPRPDGRTHDGYDIAMPPGTAVTAPLDGKVVKVWDDQQFGGGLSMRVQLSDGNTLGIAHLSAANLKEGDTVNQGQVVALSGKTGNATGLVLHVALQNPDGQYVDYFGASKAQPDPAGKADPDVLQRAIDMAKGDNSLDPYQQKQVVRYMESEHSKERSIQEQQYLEVKQQVSDALIKNGGDWGALPAQLRDQVRPTDVLEFQARARGLTEAEQKQAEVPVLANWKEHPELQTVAAVNEAYAKGQLTQGSYLTALGEAQKMENDPQKVKEVSFENDRLKYFASQAGMPVSGPAAMLPAAKKSMLDLQVAVQNGINQEQVAKRRALTQDEKDAIMKQQLAQRTISRLRSAWNPLVFTGIESPNETTMVHNFEVPTGATHVVPGSDGKMHYTDGKSDLGVVQ